MTTTARKGNKVIREGRRIPQTEEEPLVRKGTTAVRERTIKVGEGITAIGEVTT